MKYTEALLPIIEETNQKAFQKASLLMLLGLILFGCTVGFLEPGCLEQSLYVLVFCS